MACVIVCNSHDVGVIRVIGPFVDDVSAETYVRDHEDDLYPEAGDTVEVCDLNAP